MGDPTNNRKTLTVALKMPAYDLSVHLSETSQKTITFQPEMLAYERDQPS